MADLNNTTISDSGFVKLPSGTSAQRDGLTPALGMTRYNTDHSAVEYYDGSAWVAANGYPKTSAGGTFSSYNIIDGEPYTVYKFTDDGTLNVSIGGEIEYLIVAGGGGGGGVIGGGGGAGGLLQGKVTVGPGTYPVQVGAGGIGGVGWPNNGQDGARGGSSSWNGIEAIGGGGGYRYAYSNRGEHSGGSGGGSANGSATAGSGTAGQGFPGGNGGNSDWAGGGGGAGGPGGITDGSSYAGEGGIGIQSNITGEPLWYAAGGGGATRGTGRAIRGPGRGGGGQPSQNTQRAQDGAPNTGGGGGGGGYNGTSTSQIGGTGGSGIVVLRHKTNNYSTPKFGQRAGTTTTAGGSVADGLIVHLDATNPACYDPSYIPKFGNPNITYAKNLARTDIVPGASLVNMNTTLRPMVNGAFEFNGSTSYMDTGTDYLIADGQKGWTQEFWINTTSGSTLQHFISAENDSFNANWTALLSSKLAIWNVSPGYWKYGSTLIQSNTWYQCVFVLDGWGSNMQFYVNGEPEGGDHVGNNWVDSYRALYLRYFGRYEYAGSYSRYWTGKIAVMKMYNQALSAGAIKQNFEALRGRYGI